jgi:hypothetical protein
MNAVQEVRDLRVTIMWVYFDLFAQFKEVNKNYAL